MRTKDTSVATFPVRLADAVADAASAQIATIVSLTLDGALEVDLGAGDPAVPARLAVRATRDRIEAAIAQRQQAVVVFDNGDRSKPIIVGFLEPLAPQVSPEPRRDTPRPDGTPFVEADVDGRRVRVTAQDEIVLQCGSASVTLRRNGRVVIRGTYVETHSEGTNRIKGGQVQIN